LRWWKEEEGELIKGKAMKKDAEPVQILAHVHLSAVSLPVIESAEQKIESKRDNKAETFSVRRLSASSRISR
jgi:hypothetical protein